MADANDIATRYFVLLSNLLFLALFGYLLYKIIVDRDYNKILNAVLIFFTGLASMIYHWCDDQDSPGDDGYYHVCILPFNVLYQADFIISIVTIANALSYSPPVKHYWIRDNSIVIIFLLSFYVNFQSSANTSADTNMEILAGVVAFLILLARWILRATRSDAVGWSDSSPSPALCCHVARYPVPLVATTSSNANDDLVITFNENLGLGDELQLEYENTNNKSTCCPPPTYYEFSWKLENGKIIWWFPFEGNLTFLITALVLGASGLICYVQDQNELYWYLHPAWHSFEAFALLFWFMFIDTIPDEHKNYQTLSSTIPDREMSFQNKSELEMNMQNYNPSLISI